MRRNDANVVGGGLSVVGRESVWRALLLVSLLLTSGCEGRTAAAEAPDEAGQPAEAEATEEIEPPEEVKTAEDAPAEPEAPAAEKAEAPPEETVAEEPKAAEEPTDEGKAQ